MCDLSDLDEDCDPTTFGDRDVDGDGFIDAACQNPGGAGTDCDDDDINVHPSAPEVCNGIDDDCSGEPDDGVLVEMYRDLDHDGFGAPGATTDVCAGTADYSVHAGDCDHDNPQIVPGAIVCQVGGQGAEYPLCLDDGTWMQGVCPGFAPCRPQPGGHGVCL